MLAKRVRNEMSADTENEPNFDEIKRLLARGLIMKTAREVAEGKRDEAFEVAVSNGANPLNTIQYEFKNEISLKTMFPEAPTARIPAQAAMIAFRRRLLKLKLITNQGKPFLIWVDSKLLLELPFLLDPTPLIVQFASFDTVTQ